MFFAFYTICTNDYAPLETFAVLKSNVKMCFRLKDSLSRNKCSLEKECSDKKGNILFAFIIELSMASTKHPERFAPCIIFSVTLLVLAMTIVSVVDFKIKRHN